MSADVDTVLVGLRFRRQDADALRLIAHRVRTADLHGLDVTTFEQAALAAEIGEPLQVVCTDATEAVVMAELFARLGVERPTVEALRQPT